MRRLDRGGPTDLEILRALAEGGDRLRSAADLGARPGVPPRRVPARLGSLVSLGYAAVVAAAEGQDPGYTITDQRHDPRSSAGRAPAPPPADRPDAAGRTPRGDPARRPRGRPDRRMATNRRASAASELTSAMAVLP
jgi:hypothetical protein